MIKRVDENGNVRLITNIRKPRKWRRYEYLQSNVYTYIDTGIDNTTNFIRMDIKFLPLSNISSKYYTGKWSNPDIGEYFEYLGNSTYLWGWRCAYKTINDKTANISTPEVHSFYVIDNNSTFAINNTIVLLTQCNKDGGRIYIGGSKMGNINHIKTYWCKIYNSNVLVRDFVPAQYNGQYGMWDLVEDKFYSNKGTGTFTVGPEIKNYDEIDEVRRTSSLLPAGVELYDYILSSGTLWIDTNFVNTLSTELFVDFQLTEGINNDRKIIGQAAKFGFAFVGSKWRIIDKLWYITSVSTDTNRHIFRTESGKYYLDSTQLADRLDNKGAGASPMLLFAASLSGSTTPDGNCAKMKLYSCKITEGVILVRNFLPCTYLGEPGMWDTIENKFYRNQGTGLFTLGNRITLKEYEYLQGDGACLIDSGLNDSNKLTVDCKFEHINVSSNYLFGSRQASGAGATTGSMAYNGLYSNKSLEYNWRTINYTAANTVVMTLRLNGSNTDININGLNFNVVTGNSNSTKFYIFGILNSSGGIRCYSSVKLFYFQMRMNNQLVRDFIPVSYNGTPGLWDKVEWKFYANAGSGSFTLGPEKASGSIYLHSHLTNLFNGFVGGGQMSLSNGILVGTGNNSDTYFYTKTTQAVNTTSYYLVGLYVEGYTSATAWYFRSPQNNSNATLIITRDGWNWGYVKFVNADSQPIWDDANRAFSGPIPKITISDCRIYKIT